LQEIFQIGRGVAKAKRKAGAKSFEKLPPASQIKLKNRRIAQSVGPAYFGFSPLLHGFQLMH
jgi:hypothetical protein